MSYDEAPAEIAKTIFKIDGRMAQQKAIEDCPAEMVKQVRHALNIFVERRKVCRRLGKEFWL